MTIDIGSGETGFDQGTMNALRDLVRNSGSASTSTLQAADATVRAALADACERELKAAAAAAGDYDGSISPDLSSALQDDVQRLADLDAAWRLASNPPPLPLAAPEPLDLRDLPDPVDPLLPNIDGRLESDRRDDIEQSLRLLGSHDGEMEEGDARGGSPAAMTAVLPHCSTLPPSPQTERRCPSG